MGSREDLKSLWVRVGKEAHKSFPKFWVAVDFKSHPKSQILGWNGKMRNLLELERRKMGNVELERRKMGNVGGERRKMGNVGWERRKTGNMLEYKFLGRRILGCSFPAHPR